MSVVNTTRNRGAVVAAAVVALVLVQLGAELRHQVTLAGIEVRLSQYLPSGPGMSVMQLRGPRLGETLLWMLLALVVVALVVAVLTAVVVRRPAPRRVVTFLAVWMAAVLAGAVAGAATAPLQIAWMGGAPSEFVLPSRLSGGLYWGLTLGAVVAAVAALATRPAQQGGDDPAATAPAQAGPGYGTTDGGSPYGGGRSPYTTGGDG